jgi:hypothetical protein
MAVVVVNEVAGFEQGMYDKVTDQVMPGGQLPEGCQVHIAGPGDTGWRVITVWGSDEEFQQFRNEKLIPAIKELGGGDIVAPKVESKEVYKLITA